ncbi:hypothetical protein B296_00032355 [Ensete ventricosum]|uniref:Uncharacterized protein n=1 Tax=Ensete ventricosum TaxID=4639 RepID=A0A426ZF78_ENSVE|nr:hypothetical protein B296_00032355 [Ensete ventricosum]
MLVSFRLAFWNRLKASSLREALLEPIVLYTFFELAKSDWRYNLRGPDPIVLPARLVALARSHHSDLQSGICCGPRPPLPAASISHHCRLLPGLLLLLWAPVPSIPCHCHLLCPLYRYCRRSHNGSHHLLLLATRLPDPSLPIGDRLANDNERPSE